MSTWFSLLLHCRVLFTFVYIMKVEITPWL